jgi:hypothetical protein
MWWPASGWGCDRTSTGSDCFDVLVYCFVLMCRLICSSGWSALGQVRGQPCMWRTWTALLQVSHRQFEFAGCGVINSKYGSTFETFPPIVRPVTCGWILSFFAGQNQVPSRVMWRVLTMLCCGVVLYVLCHAVPHPQVQQSQHGWHELPQPGPPGRRLLQHRQQVYPVP